MDRSRHVSASFTGDRIRWHREREATLASPHGFLAITGLHWLGAEPARYPDAPGEWVSTAARVSVTLAPGAYA
jgi:uncharacterized protein (DUF1684 family)